MKNTKNIKIKLQKNNSWYFKASVPAQKFALWKMNYDTLFAVSPIIYQHRYSFIYLFFIEYKIIKKLTHRLKVIQMIYLNFIYVVNKK
jgi:hypothetical protein